MSNIQTDIDSLVGGVSVFNLALNVAGIINNKRNVSLYIIDKGQKINILEGSLAILSGITSVAGMIDDSGVIMSAEVIENSKLAEHPLENGKVLADNKIHLPTEIDVRIVLQAKDFKDKLEQIKEYKNNNQMLYVETKFGSYKNMQIVSIPCSLNVDNVSRVTFNLKLREALVSSKKLEVTSSNVADSDTYNIGEVSGNGQTLQLTSFVE